MNKTKRRHHKHCRNCREVLFHSPLRCPRCDSLVPSWKLFGWVGVAAFGFLGLLKFFQFF